MKTVKLLFFCLITFIALISFSCNNGQNKSIEDLATEKADSARRADSIKQENNARMEREQFQSQIQNEIDSMSAQVHKSDSLYARKTDKERQRWIAHRARINERIQHLKTKKESAGNIAKDDWSKFKLEVDTTMTNLKTDWNNMLENMKAR